MTFLDPVPFDGIIVTFDEHSGEGTVEVPSEFRTFAFSTRCYHGRPANKRPQRGDRVIVYTSPTPDKLLSVRSK